MPETETLKHTAINEMSPSNPSNQRSSYTVEEEAESTKSRGNEDTMKTRPSESHNQNSHKLNRDGGSKNRAYMGLQQVFCIYIRVFSLIFLWDS